MGTVVELRPWRLESEGDSPPEGLIAARVKWDTTGHVNAYRWSAPGTGVRDLKLVGWRPLSVEEARIPPSLEVAAQREERLQESSASLMPALRGLWGALGGPAWTSQRGWREAFLLGTQSTSAALELLPCGGDASAAARGRLGWEGIACAPDAGNALVGLDLSGNGLAGELGAALLEALPPDLQSLNLARNALTGALPEALCRFKRLRFLNLSFNRLSGPLPACLGEAPALEVLNLSNNNLSGGVPPLWARLASLKAIQLQGNIALEGPLSQPLVERLRALEHVRLPSSLQQQLTLYQPPK